MNVLPNRKTFLSLTIFVSFCMFVFIFSTDSMYSSANLTPINYQLYNNQDHNKQDITNIGKQQYLVNTSRCQITRWPTFDDQTLPLFLNRTLDRIECTFGKRQGISIKRFNYIGIQVLNNSTKTIHCFQSTVRRKSGNDNYIYFMPYVRIDLNIIQYFPKNTTTVMISCYHHGHKVYEKVVQLIPKLKRRRVKKNNELPNILFVGLDSISRVNFDRHFGQTAKLLSKHKFYTMYGYNKVADNTFVNLTPLLTGRYLEDIWNESISKTAFLNYFPFIWKDYHNRGYKTLLAEDAPEMATFNYLKKGFDEPPTDYYLRPFSMAIEDRIKDDCYLDQTELETYYEYVYDFMRAMDERKDRYFAFTFMARLTHYEMNNAGLADPIIASFFNRLFNEKLLTNTVLVFFSDHGIRYGPIRETLSGKVEERMPFMHLHVPQKWRNSNLTINQNRLTTPFDIHATLRHIIEGKPDLNLRYGKSLLEEIPKDRSCQSIPILEHWCSCQSSESISDLTKVEPISQFIVQSINQLVAKDFGTKCAELALDRTVSAYEQHLSDKVLKFISSENDVIGRRVIFDDKELIEKRRHFLVSLTVRPSNARFEATVLLSETTNTMQIVGEVSRINLYGNQSDCIDNQFIRRYCFCRKYLF